MKDLKGLSFVIVTHVYATGPSFKLEEYLKDKVDALVFIGHPFSFAKDTRSFLRIYKSGSLVKEEKFKSWKGPEVSFYIKDLFLTIWWYLKYQRKTDYFIGVNNFNVFAGLVLGLFLNVGEIIFYTIDYVPNRFESSFLNWIYHLLDKLAISKSHKVWNLSQIMVAEREKGGVSPKYRSKQIEVPIGTDIKENPLSFDKIDKNKIVFLGHLRDGQGLELLISAMGEVIKKVKNAHLLIIGGGPLEKILSSKIKSLKLEKKVKITGFVKEYDDVKKLMRNGAIAVAPYVDDDKTYTRYTDPGKPKDYLASGMPVIITKVPQVAFQIEKNKCGLAIDYNENQLEDSLIDLLTNETKLKEFRKNAFIFAKKYTWERIFKEAISKTL